MPFPLTPSKGKSTSPRAIPTTIMMKKSILAMRPLCRHERVQLDSYIVMSLLLL